jgi:hypothetical protein
MAKNGLVRNDVGARNPYALIDNLEKRDINWKEKSNKEIRSLFTRHLGMQPEDAFGSPDSPLYRKTGTGSTLPELIDTPTGWYDYPGGVYVSPAAAQFEDPVQGGVPDCYFLAALSSWAWVNPSNIKKPSAPYNMTFWYPPHTEKNTSDIFVSSTTGFRTSTLPLKEITPPTPDQPGVYKFIYARSVTPPNELWPALYEKAYAAFKGVPSSDGDPDHPDISQIGEGSPFLALMNLTGKNLALDDTTSLTTSYTGDGIYTKIKTSMCGGGKKATKPGVAFTYRTLATAGADGQLIANHTYSVLGVHTQNSKNYIVLRNPFGQTCCKDPKMYDTPGILATGAWGVAGFPYTLERDDGIFGLQADIFQSTFEAFNWVV